MNNTFYVIRHIPSNSFATNLDLYCHIFRTLDIANPYLYDSIKAAKFYFGQTVMTYKTNKAFGCVEFLLQTEIVEVKQTIEVGPTVSLALFNEVFRK